MPGFTITGMNGLARNPITNEIFIICKVSGVSGRVLGKIDPFTVVVTQVGNLGDNFSSITFNTSGTLYGSTGNGATVPETLWKIDIATGAPTIISPLGNGADGEVICFNPDDNMIYHWSGNGTVVFEKVDTLGALVTNIPIIGATNGETFGMVYMGNNSFIGSNISSSFQKWHADGTVFPPYGAGTPDDIRGTVLFTCPRLISGAPAYCTGGTTQLSMSFAASYQWYKDGVAIGGETNQSLTVPATGFYNCMVSDACGTDSLAAGVTVSENALPTVALGSDTAICGGTIILDANNAGSTFLWSDSSTNQTLVVSGTGSKSVTVTDGNGCSNSDAIVITVNTVPVVTITGNENLCPGGGNTLTGSTGGTHQWYFNGSPIGGATAQTYLVTVPGVYNMTKTNLTGCSDSAAVGFAVVSVPVPTVALGNDTTVCTGITLTLDAQNTGATYLWSDSSSAQTLGVSAAGTFSVTVTDSNGCVNNDALTLALDSLPTVTANTTANEICFGDTITLTGSGADIYTWNNGVTDGVAFMPASASLIPYNVSGKDGNGCVNSATVSVNVNTLPVVTANASDMIICTGDMETLTGGGAASYSWDNSVIDGIAFMPPSSNTYTVIGTDSNGCMNTALAMITVNPLPTVTYAETITVACLSWGAYNLTAGSPQGGTYSGAGVTGTLFDPGVAGVGPHYITYAYTDGNGCMNADSSAITVDICTGINATGLSNTIEIYPNPVHSNLFINLSRLNQSEAQVSIYDVTGRLVIDQQVNGGVVTIIDLSLVYEGVYYMMIQSNSQMFKNKIVVSK